MECEENGGKCCARARGVQRKRRADDARNLLMPNTNPVLGPSSSQSMQNKYFQSHRFRKPNTTFHLPARDPFMNNMEEILHWLNTKRAPCLYDYDKLIKKQNEEAHSSRDFTIPVETEVPSPKKKKKKLVDNTSYLSEKQQNVYFETPQQNLKRVVNNCKSISSGSGIEVNIKNTSTPKPKKLGLHKSTKNNITRRNKISTSTPKLESPQHQNLRRSLRLQQSLNNSTFFDSSLEIINDTTVNGVKGQEVIKQAEDRVIVKRVDTETSRSKKEIIKCKSKNDNNVNGEFEDFSDVSGFTANYIRSTKVRKTPRKVRRKNNKNLLRESGQSDEDNKLIVCVNKSINTGEQTSAVLNRSTDSSQNVINLITTVSKKVKSKRVDQSTSLLKFVESPNEKVSKKSNGNMINDSFQSGSSATSRYPTRNRNKQSRKKPQKQYDRKENSPEKFVYRTRSRKKLIEDSLEQVNSNEESSTAIVNVGNTEKKKCSEATRQKCITSIKKHSLKKDSLRDKSGFATCFSDSDSDVEPKPRKFFC